MKVKSESEVAQLCLTLSDPMDCSLRGSTAHGIFQARVLEWGAIAFSEREVWYSLKSNWREQEKKKGIIHTTFKIFEKLLLIKRSFKDSKHWRFANEERKSFQISHLNNVELKASLSYSWFRENILWSFYIQIISSQNVAFFGSKKSKLSLNNFAVKHHIVTLLILRKINKKQELSESIQNRLFYKRKYFGKTCTHQIMSGSCEILWETNFSSYKYWKRTATRCKWTTELNSWSLKCISIE